MLLLLLILGANKDDDMTNFDHAKIKISHSKIQKFELKINMINSKINNRKLNGLLYPTQST